MINKNIKICILLILLINILSCAGDGYEIYSNKNESIDNNYIHIYINGNDDFTPENGVIGGDGSKNNPYIISDLYFDGTYQYRLDDFRWRNKIFEFIINYFFGEIETALTIINADKHVIIKDNVFVNWNEPLPPQDPHSEVPKLSNHRGIKLSKAKNITIEYNNFKDCNEGIDCHNSDVLIRYNDFNNIEAGYQIINLERQLNSIIEHNNFKSCDCENGIRIYHVEQNTSIIDNNFNNCILNHGAIDFTESQSFVNISNNILNQIDGYSIIGTNGWIQNNELSNCEIAIKVVDSIVCNNLIYSSGPGIAASGYYNIYNNDIIGNSVGIGFYGDANQNSTVFRNNITGNGKGFYCITTNPPSIFYNNIYNNDIGIKNNADNYMNALNNWWGASNGPGGEGAGNGDIIKGNVSFNPWLSEPVPTAGRRL